MASNFFLETTKETLPGGSEVIIGNVGGAIDSTTNSEFDRRMKELQDEGAGNLILVLEEIKYINSTGMGALIKFADSFRALGGDIKLVAVPRKVEALFEMLGLLTLFKTFPTVKEALDYLSDTKSTIVTDEDEETADEPEVAEKQVKPKPSVYPVHFACPSCKTRIELGGVGKFKCPKCSAYYSASEAGEVKALRLEESKLIEMKLPCNIKFTEGLKNVLNTYAREFTYPTQCFNDINKAIDESWALIVGKADKDTDMCRVLMVGNSQELITGILVTNEPFTNEPGGATSRAFKIINSTMDQVEVSSLPSGGQLLKMVKKM